MCFFFFNGPAVFTVEVMSLIILELHISWCRMTCSDLLFQEQKDGTSQSLLTKSIVKDRADFDASPEYVGRLDIGKQNELLVYNATLQDQRRFNCMVATTSDVIEHLVNVKVYSKYLGGGAMF